MDGLGDLAIKQSNYLTPLEAATREQFERYVRDYEPYDYFFIHYKYTDKHGEDGNFAAKRKAIEELDAALPVLFQKKPDVLAITPRHV